VKYDEEHAVKRSRYMREVLNLLSSMEEREKLWIRQTKYLQAVRLRLKTLEKEILDRDDLEEII